MSERVTEFFELVADASVFDAAFTKAKAAASEFAAGFKTSSASVIADADRMGIALQRAIATGSMPRNQANAMIAQRLKFYGEGEGGIPAGGGGGSGLSSSLGGIYAGLGIVGALGGILGMVAQGVTQYAQFSAAILRNSEAIGINAQQLQTWDKIGQQVGIDSQSMTMDFERFAKNLADGATGLKATGVTLKDLGITTTDVGQAILQLSDYFHTHNDQAQKAAIATALFGRSGAQLIPILDQGSAAFKNYQAELEKMGVLLSNSQLFAGAQAQVAIQQFGMAFDAAKDRLVAAALPGFTTFFQQLSVLIENNMPLWQELGQTIGNVVMFITGMVAGMTGQKLDFSKPLTDAGAAYQGLGGAAQNAAAGIGSAAGATKAMTDAITDQISALQEQKRAQDDVFIAQKSALQDQLDALRDVTDHRRRQGEDIVSYQRRLHEVGLQDQIKAIDKAKTSYDRAVDDHIAALQREKQAVTEAAGKMGADISAGIGRGMNAGVLASGQAISKIEQQWADAGAKYGAWVVTFFKNPSAAIRQAADTFGQLLGSAIVQGAESQLSRQFSSWLGGSSVDRNLAGVSPHRVHAAGTITQGAELSWIGEAGTEVVLPTYDRSRSLALMEQSGMADLARGTGVGAGPGKVPPIVINFNGPVATELVANDVIRRINNELHRRIPGLIGGFG